MCNIKYNLQQVNDIQDQEVCERLGKMVNLQ